MYKFKITDLGFECDKCETLWGGDSVGYSKICSRCDLKDCGFSDKEIDQIMKEAKERFLKESK